ncbi:zona pellucida sperm-binding protein 3-like [Elgaria multicarinata webbii]|uniref:zona pellucida sperm-binding protein 3-like n=1 Tax=Elgaria multicarinata webbii TaxID=159646 RepID=UPI002FCD0794
MVDSEAVFQARGPVPSSSDVIRTIVTEVEIKKMDTFFDWRVDVQSLWSNGFSLKNLEPEKLAVSFTVLGVGPRSTFGGMISWEHLENLRSQVILLLGTLYAVQNISLAEVGNTHHGIDINGMVYVNTNTHVDIGWALEVLMGLSNYSVDLTSLSINGSKLSLQVFPVSFLVTNRVFDERMMDRSSAEHQHIARDLSETLMHILSKYTSLLQVAIREITGGSLVCHGDAIFHHPAPTSKDVLQTLSLSVGPNDYLDSSSFQVDPFSFTVAGDGLEPPFPNPGFPGYGIAIIVLCTLALIAFPILALLHYSWAWVDLSQPRALSNLKPVAVQCGEAQVVVTVKRDLFGTGRLIQAADLALGSQSCQPTSLDAAEDTVIFDVGLHECGSAVQMTSDSLVYSISLYYHPNLGSNPVVVRTSPAEVPIECHYPRKDNVSSKAIQPTWVPFSSTISAEERLTFSLRLMNEDWSAERTSSRYQLGDAMHIQAEVNVENHVMLRLFIDNCVATLSPDASSSPKHMIIGYNGCLVDGRLEDSSSAFVSPRSKQDSLQFTVDVFRFAGDIKDLFYITCHLKVAAVDQPLGPLNKACSFNKARNSWSPVEGTVDICSCCETKNCGLPEGQPARINSRWRGAGGRFQRDASSMHGDSSVEIAEADVSIGPVILDVQRTPGHHLEDQETIHLMGQGVHEKSLLIMMALTIATALLALASVTFGFLLACKKNRCASA